jgi:hypothetical protein
MAEHRNPETYRLQAKQWQEKADARSSSEERDTYLVIAEGYARLALLIEKRAADAPAMLHSDTNHGQQSTIC